jgi:hypothetical protein
MGKRGMTLVELLVYIALAALLLAPVTMLLRDSSVSMARDAGYAGLRMVGRELLGVIYEDLMNTGFKLDGFAARFEATWHDAGKPADKRDSSSFRHYANVGGAIPGAEAGLYDSLAVLVGRLGRGGAWAAADTVVYKVNAKRELVRRSNRVGNPADSGKAVALARNVAALKFQYSPDLGVWHSDFNADVRADLVKKRDVRYVRAVIVLKDAKKLAPVKNQKITVIPGVEIADNATGHLYDRHETVIPIPNNGLFP